MYTYFRAKANAFRLKSTVVIQKRLKHQSALSGWVTELILRCLWILYTLNTENRERPTRQSEKIIQIINHLLRFEFQRSYYDWVNTCYRFIILQVRELCTNWHWRNTLNVFMHHYEIFLEFITSIYLYIGMLIFRMTFNTLRYVDQIINLKLTSNH